MVDRPFWNARGPKTGRYVMSQTLTDLKGAKSLSRPSCGQIVDVMQPAEHRLRNDLATDVALDRERRRTGSWRQDR